MAINVIVVDDSKQDRIRLVELLKHFENVKIIAEEGDPEIAITKIIDLKPDLLFLDIEMPKISGFDIVDAINKEGLFPTIVIVTAYEQYAIRAVRNHAFDYILKPIDIDELNKSFERYTNCLKKTTTEANQIMINSLSIREKEVLKLLVSGKTSKDISDKLCISINTVNSHRSQLLKKTNSKNIAELIIWSVKVNFTTT